eukprot:TRINITY_DN1985_c0_g1_i2.p1 TRINITY_DN1985_c0_g1~~TRINITY_DN1985_c0_g1_i2.p1  ORF type:complete len:684 (-),score=30.89 TRINITY_DN1985_c0_g1_i2:797-2731(-)
MAGLDVVGNELLPQCQVLARVVAPANWLANDSVNIIRHSTRNRSNQLVGSNTNSLGKTAFRSPRPKKSHKPQQNLFGLLSECLAQEIIVKRVFGDEEWPIRRRVAIRGVCRQWKTWIDETIHAVKPGELSDSLVLKLSKSLSHVSTLDLTQLRSHTTVLPDNRRHQRSQLGRYLAAPKLDGEILGLLNFLPQLNFVALSLDSLVSPSDLQKLRLFRARRLSLKLSGVNQSNYIGVLNVLSQLRNLESLELEVVFGQRSCIRFLQEVNRCLTVVALNLTLTDVMYDEFDGSLHFQLIHLLSEVNYLLNLTDATHGSCLKLRSAAIVVAANKRLQSLTLGKNWLGFSPLEEVDALDHEQLVALQRVPCLQIGTQSVDSSTVSQIISEHLKLENIRKLSSGGNIRPWVGMASISNLRSLSLLADGTFVNQSSQFASLTKLTSLTSLDIRLHFWGCLEDDRQSAAFVLKLMRTISALSSLQDLTITKMRFDRVKDAETKALAPLASLTTLKRLLFQEFSGIIQGEKLGFAVIGRMHSLFDLSLVGSKKSSGSPGGVVTIDGEINQLLSCRRSRSLRDSRIQTLTVWPLLYRVDGFISMAHLVNIAHLKVGYVCRFQHFQPDQQVVEYVRSSLAGLRTLHVEFIDDFIF